MNTSWGIQRLQPLLLRNSHGTIIERVQHLYLRLAVAVHGTKWDDVQEVYRMLSDHLFLPSMTLLQTAGTVGASPVSEVVMSAKLNMREDVFATSEKLASIIQHRLRANVMWNPSESNESVLMSLN